MTDVQYNKIINDLKSFSESIVVDDEIVFFNMISNYYLVLFVSEINVKDKKSRFYCCPTALLPVLF